eukprot:CAMPEP_0173422908 /NCGR_PEP_ID=MMETSP1357-20121228/3428_1 /TAXON_ID=77926 /ORGANISM="Hemiselmis rufescens, Strain PCC563" /LENGTH=85 /DNA_ID=CAMNT_0014385963 /DNA_START=46 /DNA_END=300 /DNA_ORIENTATION=+
MAEMQQRPQAEEEEDDFELVLLPTSAKGEAECVSERDALSLSEDLSWTKEGFVDLPLIHTREREDQEACARWSLLHAKWGPSPPP